MVVVAVVLLRGLVVSSSTDGTAGRGCGRRESAPAAEAVNRQPYNSGDTMTRRFPRVADRAQLIATVDV